MFSYFLNMKTFYSFLNKTISFIKTQSYNSYVYVKTNYMFFVYIFSSIIIIGVGVYGGISYLWYLEKLRSIAKDYHGRMYRKDKTDPFNDPDFLHFLKINDISSPLYSLSIEELFVFYSQKNDNVREVAAFIMPLWTKFDSFSKLAIKIYLIRCIEKDKSFNDLFCTAFIIYVKHMIMKKYGADTTFSISSASKADISIFNDYIDNYVNIYPNSFDLYFIYLKYPIYINANNFFVSKSPIFINNVILKDPNINFILKEIESSVIIKQETSYYDFINKNISYIIEIIYSIFS
jgi:hypothetical protein